MSLASKQCKPCEGGAAPMNQDQIEAHLAQLGGWGVSADAHAISRKWTFKNFKQAQAFVNQVGEIAETENHHPDISFGWGYAEITLTTHAMDGLSENDFIVAAKIDELGA